MARIMRLVAALSVLILLIACQPLTEGSSNGITDLNSGCICHGEGVQSSDAEVTMEGLPDNWEIGETYDLFINLTGPESTGINDGGFNLQVSSGTLSSQLNDVQIEDDQATHTSEGNDQRSWVVQWTAPSKDDSTTFNLLANAVNGDGSAGQGDHWVKTVSIVSSNGTTDSTGDDFFISESGIIAIAIGFGCALVFILTTDRISAELADEEQ